MSLLRRIKILLASRKIIKNWLTAGITYFLTNIGLTRLTNLEIICSDGSRSILSMSAYSRLVNDYWAGYLTAFNCRDRTATYFNGVKIPLEEIEKSAVGQAIRHGWLYDLSCKCWYKGNIKFKHFKGILDVFEYGEYDQLDVRNKIVIDVGAYVGDSAIYFALRGAEKVIAIEPHPYAYAEMLINIKLNKLEDKIIPINAALASKPGKICLENLEKNLLATKYYQANICKEGIPIITLAEVLRQYGDNDKIVLKMDCEGCEYDVILNDYNHVNKFSEIYFEYHAHMVNKPVDVLLEKLSSDFTCCHVFINNYYYRHNTSREAMGIIKCERKK